MPHTATRLCIILGLATSFTRSALAHDDTLDATTDVVSPWYRDSNFENTPLEKIVDLEKIKAEALTEAYPVLIQSIDLRSNRILFRNGESDVYDKYPGTRSPAEMIDNPDYQDQLYFVYPAACETSWVPPRDFDPGRIRHEGFMNRVYGLTQSSVERDLGNFDWLGLQRLRGSKRVGVLDFFTRLSGIFVSNPLRDFKKYVSNSAGTYNRRFIDGTTRLSSHSWGNAMDVNLDYSNYWKWDQDSHGSFRYQNRIPCRVVEEFEKQGFIWGGKWYHYDTMHFEYRPEILLFSRKIQKILKP